MAQQNSNVTSIESKKPATPATHTITYMLDGFPITTQLETTAPIGDVIARLKAIGATPPAQPAAAEKPAGVPACPDHPGRKMKVSTARPGTYYCTAKDEATGAYCKHKA